MNLPIFQNLQDGERFDFETLADSAESVEAYWKWWWGENPPSSEIKRPETILESDPILEITENKATADFVSYSDFFHEYLLQAIEAKMLPAIEHFPRTTFGEQVTRIVGSNSTKLQDGPQIVFAGGGYGSGKTTILSYLANCGAIPLKMCHMVGVDYFKFYVPEFSLIQSVADGRASVTVQSECKALASRLFQRLVGAGRSFIWDSSMSDLPDTLDKIALAGNGGYKISMVAVLTPVEIATKQAMKRALETRRFPNKTALPQSHVGFRKAFNEYLPLFNDILVFANCPQAGEQPLLIAEKKNGNELAINNAELLKELLTVPDLSR